MCAAPDAQPFRARLPPSNAFLRFSMPLLNDVRHVPGPPGLMARAKACSVVSMKESIHRRGCCRARVTVKLAQTVRLEGVHERWCPQ